MEDWRAETAADLKDAESRLASLSGSIAGELTGEQSASLWRAYLDVEKSVVFIKVELDDENPGRFLNPKDYKVPDERQAVAFALERLRKGISDFEGGRMRESMNELRASRNYLRALLIERRKLKAKSARAALSG